MSFLTQYRSCLLSLLAAACLGKLSNISTYQNVDARNSLFSTIALTASNTFTIVAMKETDDVTNAIP